MTELTEQQAPSTAQNHGSRQTSGSTTKPERGANSVADASPFVLALSGTVLLLVSGAVREAETSFLQSRFVSRATRDMTFAVERGASPDIRFLKAGPSICASACAVTVVHRQAGRAALRSRVPSDAAASARHR
jgi:hypothetical protein